MSDTDRFLQTANLNMLWEVVCGVEEFTFLPPSDQHEAYQYFFRNATPFFHQQNRAQLNLMQMNKRYVLLLSKYIQSLCPSKPGKLKIHPEAVAKPPITYEDIQQERKTQIDLEYARRREEFEELAVTRPPPVPSFADKQLDQPIQDIEQLLKDMQASRRYDVEQPPASRDAAESWLTPQDTSLKTEKFKPAGSSTSKKVVSFKDHDERDELPANDDLPLFSKLKKTKELSPPPDWMAELSEIHRKLDWIVSILSSSSSSSPTASNG